MNSFEQDLLDKICKQESVEEPNVSDILYLQDILNTIVINMIRIDNNSNYTMIISFIAGIVVGFIYRCENNKPM